MTDFMAKMAEQGPVGLAHDDPDAFARRVVGLFQIDGDDAAGMAGHHASLPIDAAEEVIRQAVFRVFRDL